MAKNLPKLRESYDPRTKYDWVTIREEFTTGIEDKDGDLVYPTLKELSVKHNVPYQSMSNRASKEKWNEHQNAQKNKIAIQRQKELQKSLAKKAVVFSEQAAQDAQRAQQAMGKRILQLSHLAELDGFRVNALIKEIEAGRQVDDSLRKELKSLVSPSEWEAIGKAYALFNDVGRKALGIREDETPTQITSVEINHNTVVSQTLKESDRSKQLAEFLSNQNLVLPGVTDQDQLELEDTIDAEVVEEDGGDPDSPEPE